MLHSTVMLYVTLDCSHLTIALEGITLPLHSTVTLYRLDLRAEAVMINLTVYFDINLNVHFSHKF